MKLSIAREELLVHLQAAARVVSTRSALQTLSGVMIQAAEGSVQLLATDMDIGLQATLAVEAEQEGTVVLPGRLLLDVVRSLPENQMTLVTRAAEQDVEIACGHAQFHIKALPASDFPRLPKIGDGQEVRLPAGAFVETIERVSRSASHDETRPILTGILVSAGGSELRMVATDSYRLSVKETTLDPPLDGSFEANIPARALQELTRIADPASEEEVTVSVRENQVVFRVGGVTLSSRLIEGQFPNYRQLLPESYDHEVRVARTELLDVVRRVSLLAQKNAPLKLQFKPGELTVSAQTPDVGEASEMLPVPFEGEELAIGFNPAFLRDGLEGVRGDEIVVKLISPLRPGLLQSEDDPGFLYLVMPIRLNV